MAPEGLNAKEAAEKARRVAQGDFNIVYDIRYALEAVETRAAEGLTSVFVPVTAMMSSCCWLRKLRGVCTYLRSLGYHVVGTYEGEVPGIQISWPIAKEQSK